jgi:uncharacterized membrane protein
VDLKEDAGGRTTGTKRRHGPTPGLLEGDAVKQFRKFVMSDLLSGLLLVVPLYLAVLLLLKAMGSLVRLVQPIALMLPRWSHAENVLALLIVLFLCFLVGVAMRTVGGRLFRARIEGSLLVRIPGYILLRSLTRQLAGERQEKRVEAGAGRDRECSRACVHHRRIRRWALTIFVPSSPSPFTGAVYILGRERVHLLDASLAQTVQAVSRWDRGQETSSQP